MKYKNTSFSGIFPVPTAAIVEANSPEEAAQKLEQELIRWKLPQNIDPSEMEPLELEGGVDILSIGNY
tara:strand:- start:235 stop:438 length:204 start_codon:yes stop_codon:yes gene_type:complete